MRFDELQEILEDAESWPPEERDERLRRRCGGDDGLLDEARSLLAALDEDHALIDEPDPDRWLANAGSSFEQAAARLGETIDGYELLAVLGAGGMGVVYRAGQLEPVERSVALKLIRPGLASAEALRRFDAERQTLAALDHPGICRLYDAGVANDGAPYFVMELVEGEPVHDFCDRHRLTIDERMELGASICRAVHHAHLRGVIHRDLKPSNVLVGLEEDGEDDLGEGSSGSASVSRVVKCRPKVIDFGIAKAIAPSTAKEQTIAGGVLGTLETMSPEQARSSSDVDIRTDVYSLGALLHRVIVGVYPRSRRALDSGDRETVRQSIWEDEPSRPSTRADAWHDADPVASYGLTFAELRERVHGDLDWILLKALAVDPDERYQSALELASDLERSLRGEDIEAGPQSWWLRTRKFVRRNRMPVALSSALVVVLLVGALVAGVQSFRLATALDESTRQRDEARAVATFMRQLFRASDPTLQGASSEEPTARDLLDRGTERIRSDLEELPETRAALLQAIGESYLGLDRLDDADETLSEALELREEAGVSGSELAESLRGLSQLRLDQYRFEESVDLAERALQLIDEEVDPGLAVRLQTSRAFALEQLARHDEARSAYEIATRLAQDLPEVDSLRLSLAQSYAQFRVALGDHDGAAELLEDVVALLRRRQASRASVALALQRLANAYREAGRYPEGVSTLRESLMLATQALGAGHETTIIIRSGLALDLNNTSAFDEALEHHLENLELLREKHGDDHPLVALTLNNLGLTQYALSLLDEAEATFREALAIQERLVGSDHPNLAYHQTNLARVFHDRGQLALAEPLYREALAIRKAGLPEDHPALSDTLVWLGALLVDDDRAQEALPLLEQGVAIRARGSEDDNWRLVEARSWLGVCLAQLGRIDEARPMVVRSYQVLLENRGERWRRTRWALERVVRFHMVAGEPQQAEEALDELRRRYGDDALRNV